MRWRCRQLAVPWLTVVTAIAGCGRPPIAQPPTLTPSALSQPGLRVYLAWEAPADLDLYVTDPSAEAVYFGNTPSRSGGRLIADARCPQRRGEIARELVAWDAPPPGAYRVGVDYSEACAASHEPVPFRVLVETRGQHLEGSGQLLPERFNPIVMQFAIRADAGDSPELTPLEGPP